MTPAPDPPPVLFVLFDDEAELPKYISFLFLTSGVASLVCLTSFWHLAHTIFGGGVDVAEVGRWLDEVQALESAVYDCRAGLRKGSGVVGSEDDKEALDNEVG